MKPSKLVVGLGSERRSSAPAQSVQVERCRSCGSDQLKEFLTLGSTPIANNLVNPTDATVADSYPLAVGLCGSCALVQLTHELPTEAIFGKDYPYFSSFSDSLVAHSAHHVRELVDASRVTSDSFVVEVASNDGYLLKNFLPHAVSVLGVEPSPGPAEAARKAGVPTLEAFFNSTLGAELRRTYGAADVIIANNVMAHVPDLNSFVSGLAALVASDGIIQVENPSVQYLIENVGFDTIYHEHFCYFSTIAVERLFTRHGLYLQDIELFPELHGGTIRWTCGKADRRSPSVDRQLASELAAGMTEWGVFNSFAARVAETQCHLRSVLQDLRNRGASIAAYGAAAKGATLLNTSGIGADLIDFVVDRSPFKQGKLMPGVGLPIFAPSELVARRPNFVLLLAWNFRDEIVSQQRQYKDLGGQFIVPAPALEVL